MPASTNNDYRQTLFAGCAMSIGSAIVTGILLFINGSFVMAVLTAVMPSGPSWFANPATVQFLLFLVPVLMVIAEWMMIDYVRKRLWRKPIDDVIDSSNPDVD